MLSCDSDPEVMSDPIISRPTLDISGALCSHTPLYFAALPAARSAMTPVAASRLLYISSWKLNSETAREEPRLRKLLGHISIYDKTRSFSHNASGSSDEESEAGASPYLSYQVPSFKAFQAAIQDQLATMAKVTTTSTLLHTDEDQVDEGDDDDSDYDSYDGDDWTDEDTSAESDESFTDTESTEGQWSECTSPTATCCDEEEDSDLWAIRPLTTNAHRKSLELW